MSNQVISNEPPKPAGRLYLTAGLVLGLLGPLAYAGQLAAKQLTVPWYVPLLGTAGAILIVLSLARSRGVVRLLCAGLFVFLAVGEWYFLLSMSKLPAYAGPVAVGEPFPAFATAWADGAPFTQADLAGNKNTILVFFRGRW
jgi:hypothetical protein